jgi:hypothetical protein
MGARPSARGRGRSPVRDRIGSGGQLAQRPLALHLRLRPQPFADEDVGVLLSEHWPAHGEPIDRRAKEDVEQGGALRGNAVTLEQLRELDPRGGTIGEPPLEKGERASQLRRSGSSKGKRKVRSDYSECSEGAYEMPMIEPSLESSRATVCPHGSSRAS